VRQMALLGFRNMVLLKLPLENMFQGSSYPPPITQMLLILQVRSHWQNGLSIKFVCLMLYRRKVKLI